METLDLLIKKFKEFKEELNKTSQENDTKENLEKAFGGFKDKNMMMDASRDAHRQAMLNKPMLAKPAKAAMPSPEEHAARAAMYESFAPSVKKNVNQSYSPSPNGDMAMSEKLECSANGQWNLTKTHIGFKKLQGKLEEEGKSKESAGAIAASIGRKKYGAKKMAEMAHKSEDMEKDGLGDAIKNLKSSTKVTSAMNAMRAPTMKAEACSKCHASPCECQTTGVNVDKFDGAEMVGDGV